jgi:spore coat polysaccharide biosynthesis protein SpsF
MGIVKRGKIIAFFDESFGNEFKMTGENYVVFWETALKVARMEKDHTIVVRPKKRTEYNNLREELKKKFFVIKNEMKKMQNVYIMQSDRWSFIEIVGISDLVITQGMTSSSTIAIICGIEGLYLDQAEHEHPFARLFKDKIVFDDPEKLISMIQKIISGAQHPLRDIPDSIIRAYDAYPDDRGIDLFRSILSDGPQKRVGVIIQARMGSTRLPGKVMRPILGKPMLEILIERLKRSKRRVSLIIATTQNKNDDIIAELARRLEVACFRGSQEDVLDRYYKAAKEYNMDVIVRITSDCPLADPALMDALIDYYFANPQIDYVSNTLKRTYPRGFDVEVFSFASLEKAAKEANKAYQREHVTPFIEENMKKLSYEDTRDSSIYRVTVDTMADFALITYIYELLHKNGDFGYRKIVDLLDSRPDLVALNKHIEQKII